jgi:hypothetical protein
LAVAEAKALAAKREQHWTKYDVADPKDVIAPQVWRSEEMNKSHRDKLKTQVKISEQLDAKCSNTNDKARNMVRLYRSCAPDEFGFISQRRFEQVLNDRFGVSRDNAEALFKLGVPRAETGEMNYEEFRKALSNVDAQPEGGHVSARKGVSQIPPDASVGGVALVGGEGNGKKRSKVRGRQHCPPIQQQGPSGKIGAVPKKPKAFTEMGVTERREYRNRNRILQLIEQNKHLLKDKFRERKELDNHSTSIKTRLSFDKLAETIEAFGVAVDPRTLQELYQPHAYEPADPHGSDTITFSQLCRRTEDYFNRLQTGDEDLGPSQNERNMELKGRYLGCRKLGNNNAGQGGNNQAPADPSKFWSHDEIPRRRKRAVGNTTDRSDASGNLPGIIHTGRTDETWASTARTLDDLDTGRMDTERRMRVEKQRLWRARWTDKTLEQKKRVGRGGRTQCPISRQMKHGNGNFLLWGQQDEQRARGSRSSTVSLPSVPESGARRGEASPWAVDEGKRYF